MQREEHHAEQQSISLGRIRPANLARIRPPGLRAGSGSYATAQGAHTCHSVPLVFNIDVPPGHQTQPGAISDTGWITGGYQQRSDGNNHCFLRSPDGTYTDCEPSGVGATASFAWSINTARQITGVYRDSSRVWHGFLRNADGSFVVPLDAPGAGTGSGQGTLAYDINSSGELAGQVIDGNGVYHSWVWVGGTFTVFDAPGAGTGSGQGTQVATIDGLDPFGNVTGGTIDSSNVYHGFVRYANGSFGCSPFDIPGAGTGAGQGTLPGGINQAGTIEGAWADDNNVIHGFVGPACGTLTTYDVPGAGTGSGQGTQGGNVNALGEVAAYVIDSHNVSHGFVREPNSMITKFDAPGAGTLRTTGTFPLCNNASGQITGWYIDNFARYHGFLRSCH
jgi:hypothetical protein